MNEKQKKVFIDFILRLEKKIKTSKDKGDEELIVTAKDLPDQICGHNLMKGHFSKFDPLKESILSWCRKELSCSGAEFHTSLASTPILKIIF